MEKFKFFVNDTDITELVSDVKTSITFESGRIIGNAPSKELSLKVYNKNGEFNNLLDFPFLLKDEKGNLKGIFNVLEKPERMTKELSLKLYDDMFKANILYSSTLQYPATIKDILDNYNANLAISINYTLLPDYVLGKIVNTYDTTETVRVHLCWIAEFGASNIFADELGNLVFTPISTSKIHDLPASDVEQFETIEKFLLSGVKFDDGVTSILSGTEENNILYVDEENIYIDSQDDLDSVYAQLQGLTFWTASKLKSAHIEDLRLGEIINVADTFDMMALSEKRTYLNASYDIVEIDGDLNTKDKSKVVHVPSVKKRIRRIQTTLDQDNARIDILAQDVDENTSKIGNLELTTEEFKTEITNIKTEVDTSIAVTEVQSEYGLSDNEETSPDKWSDTIPDEIENDKFLWMRDAVTYTNGLIMYLNLRMLSKQTADKSIVSITPYYIVTDSDTVVPSSGWQEEQPEWTFDMFLWQKERVSYSDNSFIETLPRCTPMKMKLEDVDAQLNSLVIEMSTALKQVAEGIEISREKVDSLGESIKEWARFNGAELELGMTNSQFKAILSNSELAFWQGDTKVAWLSNHELHIESAVIGKSLGVGKLRLVVENDPNDGFSFIIMNQEA